MRIVSPTPVTITVHQVIFKVLKFHVLPKIKLSQKIIFVNDPCGHV